MFYLMFIRLINKKLKNYRKNKSNLSRIIKNQKKNLKN